MESERSDRVLRGGDLSCDATFSPSGEEKDPHAALVARAEELERELAAWRTLRLGYRGVPGLPDDEETDAEAIARIRTELGEARVLASVQGALTLPRDVAIAVVHAERALRARDRVALAAAHPVVQPLVDAALAWVNDAMPIGSMPTKFSLGLATAALRARDRSTIPALHPALQPMLREFLAWLDAEGAARLPPPPPPPPPAGER